MNESEKKVIPTQVIRTRDGRIINFPVIGCFIAPLKLVGDEFVNCLPGDGMILCLRGTAYFPVYYHGKSSYMKLQGSILEKSFTHYQVVRTLGGSELLEEQKRITDMNQKKEDASLPEILVRYHKSQNTDDPIIELEQFHVGDWIDLRSRSEVSLKEGEHAVIQLSVSMQLPPDYEGLIAARSSTWLQHGVIYASSIGVIDNSYCGDDDIWHMPVYATRDTVIKANERICQFRIQKRMGPVKLITVEKLTNENRGGFGHTGRM